MENPKNHLEITQLLHFLFALHKLPECHYVSIARTPTPATDPQCLS